MAHRRVAAVWTFAIITWWIAVAIISRRPTHWAVRLTNPAFALGLVWMYAASWHVVLVRAVNRRRTCMRAIAITTMSVLGVVLLEVPAATGRIDYAAIRGALTGAWHGPADDFIDDPVLSFRRPPLSRWSGWPQSSMAQVFNLPIHASYQQSFSTDARGFRNATAVDRADVALVGDSYIEGAYVSDDETAAVRLQELTGRTVVNLGVSGYGTLQEEIVLRQSALPLQPRAIVWFFFEGNDLDDDESFEDTLAYNRGVRGPAVATPWTKRWDEFRERSLVWNAFLQLRELSEPLAPNAVDTAGWFHDADGREQRLLFFDFYATRGFGPFERARFEKSKAAFLRVAALCRARGIRLILSYVPIKFRVYGDRCTYPAGSQCPLWHPWNLEAAFAAFCRESGIEFLVLTEPMRRAAASGRVLYAPEDSHWNAEGHRFVAELVKQRLSTQAADFQITSLQARP